MNRRQWVFSACGALLAGVADAQVPREAQGERKMYGLIGKMIATPGQRDALIERLTDGVDAMPGCLSYIVARDPADSNALWITEVWDNEASHKSSLSLPSVQNAITRGKPLIAGFGERFVTEPVGGVGLNPGR
jgi:quinol monooxygenase YgiN